MPERMELDVDMGTAEAIARIEALLAAMGQLHSQTTSIDAAMSGASTATASLGTASTTATGHITGVGGAAEATITSVNNYRDAGITAAKAYIDKHSKVGEALDKTKSKTDGVSLVTGNWGTSLESVVNQYLGFTSVFRILDEIESRQKGMIEAQRELTGDKWRQDLAVKAVTDNLELQGEEGQAVARKLTTDFAADTRMDISQAANLIAAGAPQGFDARDKDGRESLTKIGLFSARVGLQSKTEMDGLLTLITSARAQNLSVDQALAAMDVATTRTAKADQQSLIRGMVASVVPALTKGVPFNEAVSQFGVLASIAPSAEEGADQMRMLYTVSDAVSPQVKKRFSKFAAERGVLKGVIPVTDQELQHQIAEGDDSSSLSIQKIREDLSQMPEKARIDDGKFEASLKRQRRAGTLTPAAEALARDDHEQKLIDRRQQREKLEADLRKLEKKMRDQMNTDRQIEAFDEMSTIEKATLLKSFAAQADSPSALSDLAAMLGGRPMQAQAVRNSVLPQGVQKEKEIRDALADPKTVQRMMEKNRLYTQESQAINAQNQAQIERANADAVTPGNEFATRFSSRADAEYKRRKTAGEYGFVGKTGINFTSERHKADVAAQLLMSEMQSYYHSLSKSDLSSPEGREFDEKLASWDETFFENSGSATAGTLERKVNLAANELGTLVKKIDRRRSGESPVTGTNSDESPRPATSTTRPSTQPATMPSEPHADAMIGQQPSTYYNVSVGNLWTSPGGDIDLPGRFG